MSAIDRMGQRLAALEPERLEIINDSAKHAGHKGAKSGGGHYRLLIVSAAFAGKSTVMRHRMIYEALGEMMRKEVHALSIQAHTPGEI
jgi:BolA protein